MSSFYDGDLQVYDFGDSLEDNLGGLLEEGLNEYNDETFGELQVETSAPVGEWQAWRLCGGDDELTRARWGRRSGL